jgi:uncharacterized protein YgiM (DUF1202 family)
MNTNMVTIIKRIIAEQGEVILGDTARLKGFVADYASRESKAERIAFGRCIEYGAYTELKNTEDEAARQVAKAVIARRVHANEGLDIALCNDALDALEAALFGEVQPKKARCLKCGRELEAGRAVCPFCGRAEIATQRLETVMTESAVAAAYARVAAQPEPTAHTSPPVTTGTPTATVTPTTQTVIPTTPESERRMGWVILVALVALAAFAGWAYYTSQNDNSGIFSPPPVPTTVPVTYATVSEALNMRSGPSVDYTVVHKLVANSRVEVVSQDGNWTKIVYGNQEGFVNRAYLRNDSTPTQVEESARKTATPPSFTKLPPAPATSTNDGQSIVRIVNNTGYSVYYAYVVAVPAQYWGDDKLGSSDILPNGSSVSIRLPSSSTNKYGIRLKDLDGDTYTKWNISISNNQTITFTIEDIDSD